MSTLDYPATMSTRPTWFVWLMLIVFLVPIIIIELGMISYSISTKEPTSGLLTGIIMSVIWTALYWFPAIVAWLRYHPQTLAITVLNGFLGWTGLGWIAALVWACTSPR
jgi:Superinfection immunity protein